jgi:hypothetical protein
MFLEQKLQNSAALVYFKYGIIKLKDDTRMVY